TRADTLVLPPAVDGALRLAVDALGGEADAPAAAEDAVVVLDQCGERVPGRLVQRPDRVGRFLHEPPPTHHRAWARRASADLVAGHRPSVAAQRLPGCPVLEPTVGRGAELEPSRHGLRGRNVGSGQATPRAACELAVVAAPAPSPATRLRPRLAWLGGW